MAAARDEGVADIVDSPEAGARFIRGSVVRLATFSLGILLSLGSVPLVTRHLGPQQYGYFGTVSAMVFIIGGFTEGGLTTLAIREYSAGSADDRAALLRNMLGLRISATSAAVLLAAAVTALLDSPREITLGVLVAGAGLIVTIVGENFTVPLQAQLRITATSIVTLLQQGVLAAVYVVLVLLEASTVPFLGATVVSGAALLVASMAVLGGGAGVRAPLFDLAIWRRLLARTLPYAVAAAVGVIYFREALVLIPYLSSSRQAGYYAAAFRIVEVLTTLPWIVISAAFPIFARAARDDLDRLTYGLQRLFETAVLLGTWMSLCVVVAAPLGVSVVAGPKFHPAIPVLQIQSGAILTSCLVATFGFVMLSLQMYRSLLWSNAAAVLVATVLASVLIPGTGSKGAAIAPTAAEAVLALCYATSLARRDRSLRVSLAVVPRIAVAGGAAVAAAYTASGSSIVRLGVVTAVYFVVAQLVGAVPFELRNAVLRRSP